MDYVKTTDFAIKDTYPPGTAAKVVKGTEHDVEYNNIAAASATKADSQNAILTGTTTYTILDGGVIDGGTF